MRLDCYFFTIILYLSAGVCYARIQDGYPSFPICGGVSCEECLPLERQTAPGIGLELSLSHGTAAISFQNGTIYDVPLVQGNSIYQAAMRDLSLQAKLLRTGHKDNIPAIGSSRDPDIHTQPVLEKLLPAAVFRALRNMACTKAGITSSQDQWVNIIAEMLQALKKQIEQTHETRNTNIWLSVPSFAWNVEPVMQRLREAAMRADIHIYRYQLQGLAAMKELHSIEHCWDEDCDCQDNRRHPNVLVMDRSNQTLGLSLYTRWQGMLETKTTQQEYYFGPYYSKILKSGDELDFEKLLWTFLAPIDDSIDRVVLTGSGATDPLFLSALRAVFEASRDLNEQSYLRDTQSHTFASARQGARQSRLSNMGAFLGCEMPKRCFHGKDGVVRMEIQDRINKELYERKSEL